jgi:25S rRNA (uracil2634-N3)-methyltransferase
MKLGSPHGGGGNAIRSTAWDRIVFNFPHTGGLTKDVNRQVRANQELLVRFFEAAKPFLAPGGVVVVTVFEGQPYELWNLRDLGRHVGMRVGRSFRFPAEAYPGYRHARTLGNVEGGGGWRGEERPARTYCFEVPGDDGGGPVEKRRKGGDDEDENEGED